MNLRRAISYPYRNMPKIISMVLILGIALVVFASMLERGEEMNGPWPYRSEPGRALVDLGLAGLILTFPCFVAWLMGYSLEVIRHTGEGFRSLPAIHFFRNLASGLAFLFSRFVWGGVGVLVVGLLQGFLLLEARQLLVRDIALIAFTLIFAFETVAAATHCAVKNRLGPAFALPKNMAIIFENRRAFLALIARLVLLNAAYVIANYAILQTITWIETSLTFSYYLNFIAIFCVGVVVFLIQYMSSLHLIGQFANCVVPVEDHHDNKANYGDY